jgi:predicted lipoprotein with Yx(FWY)xxD motif
VNRRILISLGVLAVVAAVAAGCGSSNSGNGSDATAATSSSGGATSVVATHKGKLGTYLVDGKGRTLYLFEGDKPGKSNCNGGCLSIWPAFAAGAKPPVAKDSVIAGKLGVTAAGAGGRIVSYNGHPLYHYAGDMKPGDTTGQGLDQFGAEWYVVSPAGDKIDED